MTRTLLAAAILVLATACSSPSDQPEHTGEQQPSPAAHGSLAECLKEQGVAESGGPAAVLGPPEGVDPAAWDKAMQACVTYGPGPAGP